MCNKVRAHHGLCIQFFEGKGYSEAFTRHMSQVIKTLEKNPEIELAASEDEICSCCPNYGEKACETSEKVTAYDRKVLEFTGTVSGQKLSWQEFVKRVEENIIGADRMSEVCGDCGWAEICHIK